MAVLPFHNHVAVFLGILVLAFSMSLLLASCRDDGENSGPDIYSSCFIDYSEYENGELNPDNPCFVCAIEKSVDSWSPAAHGSSCDDGMFCNGTDSCDGSGRCGLHAGDPCESGLICKEETDSCRTSDDDDNDNDSTPADDDDDDDDNDNDSSPVDDDDDNNDDSSPGDDDDNDDDDNDDNDNDNNDNDDDNNDNDNDDDTIDGTYLFVGSHHYGEDAVFWKYENGEVEFLPLPDPQVRILTHIQQSSDGRLWMLGCMGIGKNVSPLETYQLPGLCIEPAIILYDLDSMEATVYGEDVLPEWQTESNFSDLYLAANGDVFVSVNWRSYFEPFTKWGIYHYSAEDDEWSYQVPPVQYNYAQWWDFEVVDGTLMVAGLEFDDLLNGPSSPVIFQRIKDEWVRYQVDYGANNLPIWNLLYTSEGRTYFSTGYLFDPLEDSIFEIVDGVAVSIQPYFTKHLVSDLQEWQGRLAFPDTGNQVFYLSLFLQNDEGIFELFFIDYNNVSPVSSRLRVFDDEHVCLTTDDAMYYASRSPYLYNGRTFIRLSDVPFAYAYDCLLLPDNGS